MSKTDMSYYKDLLGRMAGATLGGAAAKTLPPIKGLSGSLLGAAKGAKGCLLYTSPSPRDGLLSRMPSSA